MISFKIWRHVTSAPLRYGLYSRVPAARILLSPSARNGSPFVRLLSTSFVLSNAHETNRETNRGTHQTNQEHIQANSTHSKLPSGADANPNTNGLGNNLGHSFQKNANLENTEHSSVDSSDSNQPVSKHSDSKQPITKELLLSRANSALSRLAIHFKWILKRSNRPLNTDDYSAFFTWLMMGNVFLLFLGTTTFISLVIFTINPIFSQEFVARKLGELMTKNSNLTVTFEHAIVPSLKDNKISFKKCFVSKRPKCSSTFLKGSQADAYARSKDESGVDHSDEAVDDGNYTQFDLTIEEVNVSFSFRKWVNGTGIIDTIEINGLRGVVDRTHVHWIADDDPTNYKNVYQFGDFEFNNFVMKDVLFTLRQPNGFRPFKVAIYNCELDRLRKHWLFYDFLNANNVSGSYDNSLFTIHKRQKLNDFENDDVLGDDDESLPVSLPWKRVTRLRVDALNIDHLNKGLEGPFGWITSGKVDLTGDVMVSEDSKDLNLPEIVSIIAESIHKEANRYRNPEVHVNSQDHISRLTTQNSTNVLGEVSDELSKYFVLDLTIRLNNVRASVPFKAPELSYVNYALIRPIVAYINSRNAFIEIKSRVVKNIQDFSGSWTLYDSLLMDDISEQVYDSFVNYVADDENRLVRMRKVAFWSVQLLVQVIVFGLGALT